MINKNYPEFDINNGLKTHESIDYKKCIFLMYFSNARGNQVKILSSIKNLIVTSHKGTGVLSTDCISSAIVTFIKYNLSIFRILM